MKAPLLTLKRIYEPPASSDGARVLVDKIWPRGIAKADAALDHWAKEIAPSTELRKWFGHDPAKWQTFRKDYCRELDANAETPQVVGAILALARSGTVTLLYAARDSAHNNAVVLKDYIEQKFL